MERKKASDFPQPLLDLFDKYVHGDVDRRGFLEQAQKFATGGVTAAALLESLRPNFAWAQQVAKDDPRIQTELATVPSPQGNGSILGLFVRPAKATGKLPAILVIHENRGLNPYIEDVARRLGTEGYVVFAPDGLTSVGGYPGDEDKGREAFTRVDRQKMFEDFVASAQWLQDRPSSTGRLGTVGFCFGGGVVNALAVRLGGDLAVAVSFYGAAPPAEDVPKIKAVVLVHHGSMDTRLVGGWPAYESALKGNGVRYSGYVYEGAQHGFHNDTTPRFDEAAAKLAWQRTLDVFDKSLRG